MQLIGFVDACTWRALEAACLPLPSMFSSIYITPISV